MRLLCDRSSKRWSAPQGHEIKLRPWWCWHLHTSHAEVVIDRRPIPDIYATKCRWVGPAMLALAQFTCTVPLMWFLCVVGLYGNVSLKWEMSYYIRKHQLKCFASGPERHQIREQLIYKVNNLRGVFCSVYFNSVNNLTIVCYICSLHACHLPGSYKQNRMLAWAYELQCNHRLCIQTIGAVNTYLVTIQLQR